MPNLRSRNEINKEIENLDQEDSRMYLFAKQNLRLFYQAIDKANEQLDTKDKIKTPLSSKDIENDDVFDNYILDCLIGEKGNEASIQSAQKKKRVQQKAELMFQRYNIRGAKRREYSKKYGLQSLVKRLPSYTTKIAKEDGSDSLECEKHNISEHFMYGDPEYKQVILEEHFKKIINFDHSKTVDILKSGDPEKLMDYTLEEPEIIYSMFTTFAIFNNLDSEKTKKEVRDYQKNIMTAIDGVGGLFQSELYSNNIYRLFDTSSLNATNGKALMFAFLSVAQKNSLIFIPGKDATQLQKDTAMFWKNADWANYGAENDEREMNIKLAEYIIDPLKYKAVQIVNDKEVEVPLLKVHEGEIDGKIVERTQKEKDILNGEFVIDAEKEHYKEIKQEVKEMRESISKAKSLEELQTVVDEEMKRYKENILERERKAKAEDDRKFNEQFDKLTDRQKQLFGDAKIMYSILAGGVEQYNQGLKNDKKLSPPVFDRWKVFEQVCDAGFDKIQRKALEVDGQKTKSTELAEKYYKELGYDKDRLGKDLGRSADGILLSENNSRGYDNAKRQNMADIALLSTSSSYVKPLQKIIQNRLMNANIGEIIKYGVETDPIKKLDFYQKHEDNLKALFGSYKSINIDDGVEVSNKETRTYLANMRTFFEGVGGLFDPKAYTLDMLRFLPKTYSDEDLINIATYAPLSEIKGLSKEERKVHIDKLSAMAMFKSEHSEYQDKVHNRRSKLFGIKSLLDCKAVNAKGEEVPFDDYILGNKGIKLAERTEEEKAQIQKMFAPEYEDEMKYRANEIEFTRKLFEKTPEESLDNLMKSFARNKDAIFESAGLLEAEKTGKEMNETVAKNQKIESLSDKKREYAKHNFLWKIFMPEAYRSRSEISKAEKELKSSMTIADKLYLKSAEKNSFDKKGFENVINDFKKSCASPEENATDKTKLMSDYASIMKYIRKFPNEFNKTGITVDDITATIKTLMGNENETAINEIANETELQNIDKKLAETYDAIKERNSASVMQKLEGKSPDEIADLVKLATKEDKELGDEGQDKQQEVDDISTKKLHDNLMQRVNSGDVNKVKEEKENSESEINSLDKKDKGKGI